MLMFEDPKGTVCELFAEIFIQRLVELGEHFDDLVIGIAVIRVAIVTGAVPARTPNNRNFLLPSKSRAACTCGKSFSSKATW